MRHSGYAPGAYPSTKTAMREKLDSLSRLGDGAGEWDSFTREVLRLPLWMLPAVRTAVRRRDWDSASDPLEKIRNSVRGLAIEMQLNNGLIPVYENFEEETGE